MAIATLVLAAGSSSRLGEPKQLLAHNGQTLVRYTTTMALALQAGPVVVVVGACRERIQAELTDLPVLTPVSEHWSEGIAASLIAGLQALPPVDIEAVLILLTDQPYVTTDLLQQLIDTRRQTGRGIVACHYAGQAGVPALFDKRYIEEMVKLKGDVGAKRLIRQHANDCVEIPFPLGAVDLDTQQDVARWHNAQAPF